MIKTTKEKTYYETELINEITCAICGKDIMKEDMFRLKLDNCYLPTENRRYLEFYDNVGVEIHICEKCTKNKLKNISKEIDEILEIL